MVQVLPVGSAGAAMPSKVETGDGGQAAGLFSENQHRRGFFDLAVIVPLGGLIAAAAVARRIRRSRRAVQ